MKLINPYSEFGTKHKACLDFIIANLPPNPSFDQLNEQLVAYFYVPDPVNQSPFDLVVPVFKTALPNTYNGYVSGGSTTNSQQQGKLTANGQQLTEGKSSLAFTNYQYTTEQQLFIIKLTETILIVPPLQTGDYLNRIEEEIITSGLNLEQQTPLLLALALGKASHEYWLSQIQIAAAWVNYLNAESLINYGNLPHWVSAAMQGSLLANGLLKPSLVPFTDVLVSTIAGTGLVAGKVVFGWIGG